MSWRRLHGTDRSGWWNGGWLLALGGLIFFRDPRQFNAIYNLATAGSAIWLIMLIVFWCQRGTLDRNRYG